MMKKIPSYLSSSDDSSDSSSDESEDIVQPIPKIISKNSTLSSAAMKSNLISQKPKPQTLTAGLVSISETKRPIQNITNPNDGNPNGKTVVNVEDEPSPAKKPTTTMPEPEPLVDSSLMALTTPADVKEYQNSYVFEMDMPGMKSSDIKVEVEDDDVVVITGKRKREEEGGGVKYLNMEQRRRFGKFTGRFLLPGDADVDTVSASCQDGVLSVTVLKKLPPPLNPNKPRRTIEVVKIA